MFINNENSANKKIKELVTQYKISKVLITDYIDANNQPGYGYNIFKGDTLDDTIVVAIGSNIRYMSSMLFRGCGGYIRTIKFHQFNNSENIESMNYLFSFLDLDECPNLSDLNLSSLTTMEWLFVGSRINGCVEIKNDTLINLATIKNMFDSAIVGSIDINIKAPKITSIEGIFKIINVKNSIRLKIREGKPIFMDYILYQAHIGGEVDFTGVDFSNITGMRYAFWLLDSKLLNLGVTCTNSSETVEHDFVLDKDNDKLTIRCVSEMAKFLEQGVDRAFNP